MAGGGMCNLAMGLQFFNKFFISLSRHPFLRLLDFISFMCLDILRFTFSLKNVSKMKF